MSQSAVLVASLAAAFVLYVAARGRLAAYSTALLGPAPKPAGGGGGGGNGGIAGTGVSAGDVATVASAFI